MRSHSADSVAPVPECRAAAGEKGVGRGRVFQVNPPRYLGMGVEVPDQIDQVAVPLGADVRDIGGPQGHGLAHRSPCCRADFVGGCPEHVVFSTEEADTRRRRRGFSPAPRRRHGGCGDLGLGI